MYTEDHITKIVYLKKNVDWGIKTKSFTLLGQQDVIKH